MPISTILDKSALEMLGQEEARWLEHYYFINVVPPLFAEIHMDLAKGKLTESKRRARVASLATKIGIVSCGINEHHEDLVAASLLGHPVPMAQKAILRPDRVEKDSRGRRAAWFGQSEADKALERWRSGEFTEEDISVGARLRTERDDFDLDRHLQLLRDSSLLKEKNLARDHLSLLRGLQKGLFHATDCHAHIELCMEAFRVREDERKEVWTRWERTSDRYLRSFAPYAYYCYTVRGWFLLLMADGGYSPSTHSFSDIEYLYYLPFCSVFCSNDKLHLKLAEPLRKPTQVLLGATQLKTDLRAIDRHWRAHEAVFQLGSMNYARFPPELEGSVTCKLWDRYIAGWRIDRRTHWEESLEALARRPS